MIYGLPIVLNKYLLIPFLLVPIFNFIFAYIFLSFDLITFIDIQIHWTTPVFINTYLKTDGNIFAMLLQFSLIVLGILIYLPFIKKYHLAHSSVIKKQTLENILDFKENLKIIQLFTRIKNNIIFYINIIKSMIF